MSERRYSDGYRKLRRADEPRRIAYEVLHEVATQGALAHIGLPKALRQARREGHFSDRDAAFTSELVHGTLRAIGRLDWVIARHVDRPLADLDPRVLVLARMGAHQLLDMRVPDHAAVSATVDVAREHLTDGPVRFVNAVLRSITREEDAEREAAMNEIEDPDEALGVRYSHPAWMVRAFRQALEAHGYSAEELEDVLAADNEVPTVTLVARPVLMSVDELADEAEDILDTRVALGAVSPRAVLLESGDPARLPSIRDGRSGAQDEGSQLAALIAAQADPAFAAELETLMTRYLGRPTAVTELRNLPLEGNARILLKREDLVHGGAHKGNQVLGQALLAKRMGKRRIIAETGAGQHGTATAMVCALLGLDCTIYRGATDVVRQAPNVERMELMGATVGPVDSGAGTLKDAVNEALRDWTASFADTHYLLGTAAGPHPFPTIVREYHRVISREARAQVLGLTGRLPDSVIACVGGGSNAIGMFAEFVDDPGVELIGVEPAGEGLDTSRHGAPINKGLVGILHGARSYLMRTSEGQVEESFSVSAGLDYPGVGPEHAWLSDTGRARYVGISDDEAIEAFRLLSRHEGIIPAVESAHALAQALAMARQVPDGEEPPILLVCLSGRGDKDLDQVQARLGGSFSTDGAVARASRMGEKMGKRTEYAGLNAARGTSPDAGPDEEF